MATLGQVMASLPERFRPKMAGIMTTTIQFDFTGPEHGRWWLRISEGECSVGQGNAAAPDATVTMRAADFVGINDGSVHAPDIFWSGRIEIEGSVDAVLALPPIMQW